MVLKSKKGGTRGTAVCATNVLSFDVFCDLLLNTFRGLEIFFVLEVLLIVTSSMGLFFNRSRVGTKQIQLPFTWCRRQSIRHNRISSQPGIGKQ